MDPNVYLNILKQNLETSAIKLVTKHYLFFYEDSDLKYIAYQLDHGAYIIAQKYWILLLNHLTPMLLKISEVN